MRSRIATTLVIALFVLLSACQEEKIPIAFKPRNDHEAYQHALKQANLLNTALGQDWSNLAKSALETPISISSPYEEAIYVDDKAATALGFRFNAKKGQKVQVKVTRLSQTEMKTFVDLFRVDETETFRHVASADSVELLLGFEPRRDAEYVLRFQPELLRGGQFKITIENVPSLSFPVAGKTASAIQSFWGADRDGGRRSHEGVDIFAPRGTPILAPTDGYVRTAGVRGIGGNVVWLYDSKRSQSLYFAHLNEILVEKGDRIKLGDTLGTVGNTGNARTTPPHLHFGIYQNGAKNPINHLRAQGKRLRRVNGTLDLLGAEVRLNKDISMRTNLNGRNSVRLSKDQIATAIGINANQYRIELPDGRSGYVSKNALTSLEMPLERLYTHTEGILLKKPDRRAFYAQVSSDEELSVLGKNRDFWLVSNSAGETGWITNDFKNTRKSRTNSDIPR
ncbi:M23 family metallopeptidase [Roseivirga sp. E12]|uniref:M23 family metallopeptidase n=1 Tax=Roseivirga sp. E12 TaxID=2819237 RepID=UPI001ABC5C1F|nr:M23 family metallopeptidase [Roseivirga sp. E12]MBO3697372.1 M23 family metallopeptidase [Roseivirga sp. E12]